MGIVPIEGNGETTSINIGLVAFPISLALVTSIIGWYAWSDIAPLEEEEKLLDGLSSATSNLKDNVNILSSEILSTKNKYERTTNIYVANLHKLFNSQKETIEEYDLSLSSLKKSNIDFRSQISQSLKDFKNFNEGIKESTISLNKDVSDIQKRNQTEQLEAVKKFFEDLYKEVNGGKEKIELFNNEFDKYLNSIKNDFSVSTTKISDFLNNTDDFNNNINTNIEKTNSTLSSIDDEFKNIKNEIYNIKSTILNDLYENHSLRNDIKQINESIKNLKPTKYITFSLGLSNLFERLFKKWKQIY